MKSGLEHSTHVKARWEQQWASFEQTRKGTMAACQCSRRSSWLRSAAAWRLRTIAGRRSENGDA